MAGPIYTQDGRMIVVESTAPEGFDTFVAGRADKLDAPGGESKNGTGEFFQLVASDQQEVKMTFSFAQPVFLQNGKVDFTGNWSVEDYWSLYCIIPATKFKEGGLKNVSKIQVGPDRAVWAPCAEGTGTHEFSNSNCVPIFTPSPKKALWSVNFFTEEVSVPSAENTANCMLLDFETTGYFIRDIPVSKNGFDTQLYKSQWIPTSWKVEWKIARVSGGQGRATAWILTYRQDTTLALLDEHTLELSPRLGIDADACWSHTVHLQVASKEADDVRRENLEKIHPQAVRCLGQQGSRSGGHRHIPWPDLEKRPHAVALEALG